MKTILLLLIFTISVQSQTRTFKYNWQIADGTLIINFANNREFPEYSSSRSGKGRIDIACRQTYLDLIDVLRSDESAYYKFGGMDIYTGLVSDYLIIIDASGCLWKLYQSDALILAQQLSLPLWIAMVTECEEIICCTNKK